jgi:ABC-type cobalamin/Fe3+-siderophores transport system ATPase subunit
MGLVPFRGGHISFDGELLTPLSAAYFRHFMGYVPSRLELIPGQDRVADARRLLQGLSAGRQQLLPTLPGEERLWGQLSRQEQYLVLLQLVVSQQRRLLLVDEPHCALSLSQQYEAEVLLRQALSAGASIVVVSSEQSVRSLTPNIIEL